MTIIAVIAAISGMPFFFLACENAFVALKLFAAIMLVCCGFGVLCSLMGKWISRGE